MTAVDWGTVPQWIAAGVAVVSLIASFAAWLALRSRAPMEEIERVELRCDAQHAETCNRLTRMEEAVRHALTKSDLGELYAIARKTESDVSGIKAELKNLASASRDLNNLLLQRGIDK